MHPDTLKHQVHSIGDRRRVARRRLPRAVFEFVDGSAEDEKVVRRNEAALSELASCGDAGAELMPYGAVGSTEPRTINLLQETPCETRDGARALALRQPRGTASPPIPVDAG